MSSPHKSIAEHLLQSEVRHRSRFVDNNTDFYQLKLHRLEQDFALLQDQLNVARIRLRTAEDFEIKYQLLTKQNASLLQQNNRLVKELGIKKLEFEQVTAKVQTAHALSISDFQKLIVLKDGQILSLLDKIRDFEHQAQTLAIRASRMHDGQVNTLKKTNQQLEGVMDQYQYTSNARTQHLAGEISKLNNQVENLQDELSRQNKRYQDDVRNLNQQLSEKEKKYQEKLIEQREKFRIFEHEAKQKFDRQKRERQYGGKDDEVGFLKRQIDDLSSLLKQKQVQLQELFQQQDDNIGKWGDERQQLRQHVRLLEEKLYQRQRQNQLQLINLKERMSKLHFEQISAFKKNEQQLVAALNDLKPDELIKDKDGEISQLKQKIQNDKQTHQRDRQEILKGIQVLKERIREYNTHAESQHKIMTSLNLNIEEERTTKHTDYENNLTFLDQQLKRAILTIQQKNLQIKKLLNQLNDLRNDTQNERKEMINKAQGERKRLNQDIDKLLLEKQATEDDLKKKEKQLKVKDRELEEQISKAAAERKAFERLQEELHNDCKRMGEELKLRERAVRDQRQKNVSSVTELNTLRRQKMGDLDRQKEEFQLLYRGRMDQLKDSLNLQIDKLRVERDRLQSQLNQCRLALTESQQDCRKVSALVAQQSKMNKGKLAQYQKKMATLNQEINMTQNLYNSFMDAKSRLRQSRNQKQN